MMWTKHDENTIEVKVEVVDTDTNKHLSIWRTFSRIFLQATKNVLTKTKYVFLYVCSFCSPVFCIFSNQLFWYDLVDVILQLRVKRQISQILRAGKGTVCNFLKHSFCELAAVSDPTICHECPSRTGLSVKTWATHTLIPKFVVLSK